jgi:hypothetical protein
MSKRKQIISAFSRDTAKFDMRANFEDKPAQLQLLRKQNFPTMCR